jgi:hypothetical protein
MAKENRPRKSHYLPKFYLAGFTASGQVNDTLYVLDQATGREWPSCPANSATERDFYVVDLGPGEDPDMMEKCLSHLEGEFSGVVRDIIARERLPEGQDFAWFLNFVASMVVRIPRTRKVVSAVTDKASKEHLRNALATRDGWADFRQVLASAGRSVADEEYEQFKRFADGEDYSVNLDQTSHVQMMAKQMIDALLPPLAQRHWTLIIAADDAPDLICSDMPVGVWPDKSADFSKPITLLSAGTVLSFPLTRRLIAVARYEKRKPVLGVGAPGVALFNTWTLSDARRVFSPGPDFSFLLPDKTIGRKADLQEIHRRRRERG